MEGRESEGRPGTLGEGRGGLDGGKSLERGMNNQRDIGRRVWRIGWGQVSGEWDEQSKGTGRRMWRTGGASVWRVG